MCFTLDCSMCAQRDQWMCVRVKRSGDGRLVEDVGWDSPWMVDLFVDVLGCWSTKYRKDVADGWHMKWWCRCRLVEFELLMLTAVSTVSSFEVHPPRRRWQWGRVSVRREVVSLPVDVNLVIWSQQHHDVILKLMASVACWWMWMCW